jgi:hypothetical protein
MKYSKSEIQTLVDNCHGWNATKPISDEDLRSYTDGAYYGDYFDDEGRYLGPDDNGVEPAFDFGLIPR